MKILIDGDACPVKTQIYQLAGDYNYPVVLVTSLAHYSPKSLPSWVEVVYVSQGADAADYRIVQLARAGDLAVTQDYGLASLLLPKGVRVFHHDSTEYRRETIDQLLLSRYLNAQMRQSGQRTKGPKKFSPQKLAEFRVFFEGILQQEGDASQ